jgi:RNA polymerase sigma-70 factor (ECF subfamily)
VPDDQLRLIFLCCHPALGADAQVASTLRLLGGLTTAEIARAFLVPEPTMGQRLSRAKRKIRDTHMAYRIPTATRSPSGSAPSSPPSTSCTPRAGDDLLRPALTGQAIRVGRTLVALHQRAPFVQVARSAMRLRRSATTCVVRSPGQRARR